MSYFLHARGLWVTWLAHWCRLQSKFLFLSSQGVGLFACSCPALQSSSCLLRASLSRAVCLHKTALYSHFLYTASFSDVSFWIVFHSHLLISRATFALYSGCLIALFWTCWPWQVCTRQRTRRGHVFILSVFPCSSSLWYGRTRLWAAYPYLLERLLNFPS